MKKCQGCWTVVKKLLDSGEEVSGLLDSGEEVVGQWLSSVGVVGHSEASCLVGFNRLETTIMTMVVYSVNFSLYKKPF